MRIELRILSGARAGQTEVFDQPTILVGRQKTNDLQFDTYADLDVSARHAEIRERGGRFYVVDHESTNGTFVNGVPAHDTALKDGDIIAFGKNGPTVEVRAKGDPTGKTPAIPRTDERKSEKAGAKPVKRGVADPGRPSTTERVAIAVREQTRGMKTMLIGSMVGLGTLAIAAYWFGHREAALQVAELQQLIAQSESTTKALRSHTRATDTSFANALSRRFDSLRSQAQTTAARGNEAEITALRQELERTKITQQGMASLDFTAISAKNDNGIAMLITQLDDTLFGGTAFGVTRGGLMVTNRHNVRSATGASTTRLEVQFANTAIRLPAHVVKFSADTAIDLALIQIDTKGEYPTVAGLNGSGDVKVGSPLVTIGFPLSLELPQQGSVLKTTLAAGTASKHIPGSLLQIDAYGTHGSSGAPVFDVRGNVVGVVWGGPKEAQGRVVYAVPSDRVAAFIGDAAKGIVR